MLVPTICFNCEAACGLLAYVDKDTMRVRKFEGNPLHPASRGRNCAKGPATINQINDPERILYPLQRGGPRGGGQVGAGDAGTRCSTTSAGASARRSSRAARTRSCTTSGRPGHERTMDRVLKAWGIDGHNSHTNVCSASARLGYALWSGYDRPSPDHAQRALHPAALVAPRVRPLLQPARAADHRGQAGGREARGDGPAALQHRVAWPTTGCRRIPGSEAAVLLAMANVILDEGLADLDYVERWTNWREYMADRHPGRSATFAALRGRRCKEHYASSRRSSRRPRAACRARRSSTVARLIGAARGALRLPRLARRGQRQPGRLAGRARPAVPDRAHRQRRHGRRHRRRTPGTSSSRVVLGGAAGRRRNGTSCSSRASGRSATTRCRSCCRTS